MFRFKHKANQGRRPCCPWREVLTGTGNTPLAKSLPVTLTSKAQDSLLEATILLEDEICCLSIKHYT